MNKGNKKSLFYTLTLPAALLLTPFVNFMVHHRYPLQAPEALIAAATIGLAGLVLGGLSLWGGSRLSTFILTVCITLCIDLSFKKIGFGTLLLVAGASFILVRLLRTHINEILFWVCLCVSLSFLPGAGTATLHEGSVAEPASPPQPELPLVIHLILDEYINPTALPVSVPGASEVRDHTLDMLVHNDFHVAGGAYSQYFNTYNAIGNALNFSASDVDAAHFDGVTEPYTLQNSAYFDALSAKGYQFHIFQSNFLNYCEAAAENTRSCLTYKANSIKYLQALDVAAVQKARYIRQSFMGLSLLRRVSRSLYNLALINSSTLQALLPYWPTGLSGAGPVPAMDVLARLSKAIETSQGGEVYFAHLLLPHSGYILDASCTIRDDMSSWVGRKSRRSLRKTPNSEASRQRKYQAYLSQIGCMNSLLSEFFDRLGQSAHTSKAIVVLHGDHGSRINIRWPLKKHQQELTPQDMIDGFPTLFAIRSPQFAAGVSYEQQTLSQLLAQSLGLAHLAAEEKQVFLFDGRGKKMASHPMPAQWPLQPHAP